MNSIQNICVYCGSSDRVSERYKEAARQVGDILGKHGLGLVYGGGNVGLMGIVANAVLAQGGQVTGIIPQHLHEREVQHNGLTELHVVDSMHTRKMMMMERGDAFLVLPGGYGTLDEAFEILTWKQLALHNKPIIFLNIYNFWTPLKELKQHLYEESFITADNLNLFTFIETPEQILPTLIG